jgi:hypothetical protein
MHPVISAIAGSIATVVATGGLIYNARSFTRLRKADESRERAEQLRALEGINREIARGMKEYRLLDAESTKDKSLKLDYLKPAEKEEEEKIRSEKLKVLLSENFADISWLCFLFRHDIIKDKTLVNAFKDSIVDWYGFFALKRPDDVGNLEVFPDFQILAQQYILEKEPGIPKKHWNTKLKQFFKIGHE